MLKAENIELKDRLDAQDAVIREHQLFMERMDAKDRELNCILIGVPEEAAWQGQTDDAGKVKIIFQKMELEPDQTLASCRRIGNNETGNTRPRPIIVRLKPLSSRRDVLSKKHLLENSNWGVKIRDDKHPKVRAEWKRLFEVAQTEKNKPENAQANIFVDKRKRRVMRNDTEIDKWSIQLF